MTKTLRSSLAALACLALAAPALAIGPVIAPRPVFVAPRPVIVTPKPTPAPVKPATPPAGKPANSGAKTSDADGPTTAAKPAPVVTPVIVPATARSGCSEEQAKKKECKR